MPRQLLALAQLLAAALLLAGCAGRAAAPTAAPAASPAPAPTAVASPTPPGPEALAAGLRVDIGGRALFIRCVGPIGDGPTAILESGLGGDHSSWEAVQWASAGTIRSCSYDRAGLGQSDPVPTPRDGAAVVADLGALLAAADVRGPYVLVGHSFGALFSRLFAAARPAQVAGLVLADPVHEDWWGRALAALPPAGAGDSERLRGFRLFLTAEVADPARNAEGLDIPAVAAQVRAAGGLGDRPLVVLSAGVFDVVAPGLPADVETKLRQLFQRDLPQALTALSSDSTQIAVPDSGHAIPRQRPDIVVLAIKAVLASGT